MKTEKSLSLFSEETLDSVVMTALVGGVSDINNVFGCGCTLISDAYCPKKQSTQN